MDAEATSVVVAFAEIIEFTSDEDFFGREAETSSALRGREAETPN